MLYFPIQLPTSWRWTRFIGASKQLIIALLMCQKLQYKSTVTKKASVLIVFGSICIHLDLIHGMIFGCVVAWQGGGPQTASIETNTCTLLSVEIDKYLFTLGLMSEALWFAAMAA